MKLHETDDGFFCFLDEPTNSILWLAFFRSRETAMRAWELAQASASAPDPLAVLEGLFATDSIRQTTSSASAAAVVAARAAIARAAIAKATATK